MLSVSGVTTYRSCIQRDMYTCIYINISRASLIRPCMDIAKANVDMIG